jgi:hypothetical protein
MRLPLGGALGGVTAKAILVTLTVGPFQPVQLAAGWADQDTMPLLLGQINFFDEFDVCFFRHRSEFEVRPRA